MKNLKNFCATLALICALAVPAAGQTAPPCSTAPGQVDVPPCVTAPDPGQVDVPPEAPTSEEDTDPLTQLAVDVFWGLISII